MESQLAKSETLLPKVSIAILMLVIVAVTVIFGIRYWQASDPYISSVLSLSGNVEQGHAIFQMNCAGCHGIQATGLVGPSLRGVPDRKSKVALIQQVTSGKTPPMPQFQPSPQEMADLLSYLERL